MASPGAIVLGSHSSTGLEAIRSLSEKGIPVSAVDTAANALCFYSKFVEDRFLLPKDKEKVIPSLLRLGRAKKGRVLIPTQDYYTMVVAKNWQILSEHFLLTTPPWAITKYCIDKLLTYRIAEKLGIPVPKTYCPDTLKQLRTVADQLDFKKQNWILKSRSKVLFPESQEDLFFEVKAKEINSKRDLLRLYTKNQKIFDFALIQEKIPGMPDNNINVRAILNQDLKPIVVCTDQKIRQYPLFFGVGTYRESVLAPKVAELGLEFLKAIKFVGMAYAEFKKDPRDGEFKLIEVNPRLGMGVSLAKACGVDLTYNMYNLARGIPIQPSRKVKTGIRWINVRLDLRTILHNSNRLPLRKTVGDVISNVPRTKAFAHFSRNDPIPFFIDLASYGFRYLVKQDRSI